MTTEGDYFTPSPLGSDRGKNPELDSGREWGKIRAVGF